MVGDHPNVDDATAKSRPRRVGEEIAGDAEQPGPDLVRHRGDETPEQDRRVLAGEGPFWIAKVPVAAPAQVLAALPADVLVQEQDARQELSIFIPGRNTMAKYCTAILRMLNAVLLDSEMFVNFARLRQEVNDHGVLSSAPVERRLD